MPDPQLRTLVRQLRRIARGRPRDELTDRDLLHGFVSRRDEEAFAEVVRRHGPLVQGVCLRVLAHPEDAEDAFQATFMVLARKAGAVRWGDSVGGWLYEVAFHMAKTAKRTAARRRTHEAQAARYRPSSHLQETTVRELGAILDEELQSVPTRYRDPLVLCYLQGRTRDQAVRQLGVPLRTLNRRLARGRELLRTRLARRGLTVSAAMLAAALAQEGASATLPSLLLTATVANASTFAATPGAFSGPARDLAVSLLKAMVAAKLKGFTALLLTVGLATLGGGLCAQNFLGTPAAHSGISERALPLDTDRQTPSSLEDPLPQGAVKGLGSSRLRIGGSTQQPAPREQTGSESKPAEKQGPRTDAHGDLLPPDAIARIGTVRMRPTGSVRLLAFSPDGKTIVSAAGERAGNSISVWDVATGKEVRQFGSYQEYLAAVALSPDGRVGASSGASAAAVLWDVASGKETRRLKGVENISSAMAFSSNGRILATACAENTLRLWDVPTGTEFRRWPMAQGDRVIHMTFAPEDRLLAFAGWDQTIHVWDIVTGKEIHRLQGHAKSIYSLAFAPDARTLASGGADGTVRLWEISTGKELLRLQHPDSVHCVTYSPDGKILASGAGFDSGSTIRLWNAATGKLLRRISGHRYAATRLAFSSDGKVLASGGSDCTIRLWDPSTGQEIRPRGEHPSWVLSVAFSPDGGTLATNCKDGVIRLWNSSDGTLRRSFGNHPHGACRIVFSPNGRLLASASGEVNFASDSTIYLWDAATGAEVRRLKAHEGGVGGIAFSPDGRTLASGGADGATRLWDVATGKEIRALQRPAAPVRSVAYSPDGKLLASASGDMRGDCVIHIRDAANLQELRQWTSPHRWGGALAFSPDGRTLAEGGFRPTARLWDVATGKMVRQFTRPTGQVVQSLAFSPDGKSFSCGVNDRTVVVWEVLSGKERRQFQGHRAEAPWVAFSPDGKSLVSGGLDNSAIIWDLTGRTTAGQSVRHPSQADWENLWNDLANADAPRADRAIWTMAADPQQSVHLLRDRLRPLPNPDPQRVTRLAADLDAPEFSVRDAAMRELEQLAQLAEPSLRKVLASRPSPEARRRIGQLLQGLDDPVTSPERLRAFRAVEALERIGTPEARQLLKSLASGAPDARLTQEAAASLKRLAPPAGEP
jgi:RNA polymerase sigma factor (sigma-70 family)